VESQVDQGSTFALTIEAGPLDDVSMINSLHEKRAADDSQEQPQDSEPRLQGRVLLAEDSLDNQRLISLHLKRAGLEVALAGNGSIAYEKVMSAWDSGEPFDLVLMDMQMPVMDGYQTTGMLRKNGYKGAIVALTAHAMPDDRQECIDSGCDNYATKPIDPKALLELIASYVHPRDPLPSARS
jgi:Amt family ammonium transporter